MGRSPRTICALWRLVTGMVVAVSVLSMHLRTQLLLALALAGATAAGCSDGAMTRDGKAPRGVDADEAEVAAMGQKLTAGPAMARNLSNREYLNAVSDLLGEKLSPELVRSWTATTQFSGFDAVAWTNLDAKAVRDRGETLEAILDIAVAAKKVVTCTAASADALAYDSCAKKIIEPFAKRAYGRPLTDGERTSLAKRYADGVALAQTTLKEPGEIFLDGLRAPLGTVLLAPQFVNRIEAPPTEGFKGERDLDSYELASRLSLLFTGSIPDDELWSHAEDGSLAKDPEVLRAQAERLLDAKTASFVQSFMGQWFDFRALDAAPDGSIERLMWNESWRTLADVVKNDSPATAILDPGFAYVNRDLAKHYNLVGEFPEKLTRVSTRERGGILQQGSWLTLSATALKTSPIHRGRLVQDRLLCKVVPLPDAALFEQIQKVSESIPATATVKERVESHRKAGEVCAGCHQYMDPIGIGLEGFDQHGRLRKAYADSGRRVETDSSLLGKPFDGFRQLNDMLAALPDFQRCAAEKIAVYSIRRVVDATEDAALLDYLTHPVNDAPPSLRAMVLRMVESRAFRTVKHGGTK